MSGFYVLIVAAFLHYFSWYYRTIAQAAVAVSVQKLHHWPSCLYSLAVHEPEIQAVNSPISGQDAIEECNEAEGDDVGELEQVTQLGREKTESFFTRYIP